MPHAARGECVILRQLCCPRCRVTFFICVHCYRGQRYCGAACHTEARRLLHRAANQRYQRTEAGRLDHNDRQSVYRRRCRLRNASDSVTDQSSLTGDSAPSFGHGSPTLLAPPPTARRTPSPPRSRAPLPLRCAICGRPGVTAIFWRLYLLGGTSRLITRPLHDAP